MAELPKCVANLYGQKANLCKQQEVGFSKPDLVACELAHYALILFITVHI